MNAKQNDSRAIAYLEAFYGGSHRDFADGLIAHSRHSFEMYSLPARNWKKRIRSAALELAASIEDPMRFKAVFSGGMMQLSDLRAVWRTRCPPLILYAHETQLSYPGFEPKSSRDEFFYSDISNMLAADTVVFNSFSHRERFRTEAMKFLQRCNLSPALPQQLEQHLNDNSLVIYPGCWFTSEDRSQFRSARLPGPLRIVWNHRWEFDKRPEDFLAVLRRARAAGAEFQLILMGEPPWPSADAVAGNHAKSCLQLHDEFGDCILHSGYLPSRRDYYRLLARGDVVISTAIQENFGISVVEAMYFGCLPLLPDRLSYPELLQGACGSCATGDSLLSLLYTDLDACAEYLSAYARWVRNLDWKKYEQRQRHISQHLQRLSWQHQCLEFDQMFDSRIPLQYP